MIFRANMSISTAPKKNAESDFEFLERSSRPAEMRIRKQITNWIETLPSSDAVGYTNSLRSKENFLQAYFELMFWKYLEARGCSVVRGSIIQTRAAPDFFVTDPHGEKCFIEVTTSFEHSTRISVNNVIKGKIHDALNTIRSQDFFVDLTLRGEPTEEPPLKSIVKRVTNWLSSLEWDVVSQARSMEELYRYQLEILFPGLQITLCPRAKNDRITETSLVGVYSSGLITLNSVQSIRNVLRKKSGKYDLNGCPLIVVVNLVSILPNVRSMVDALYGEECITIPISRAGFVDDSLITQNRNSDGFFCNGKHPKNTRVSGVVFTSNIDPWRLSFCKPVYFPNPWASKKLSGTIFSDESHTLNLSSGILHVRANGSTFGEAFSLPNHWPEDE